MKEYLTNYLRMILAATTSGLACTLASLLFGAIIYTELCAKRGQGLNNFKALVRTRNYAGQDRRAEYRPELH